MTSLDLPGDVIAWVEAIFAECNRRITSKLGNNPNAPEQSFDLTWIEELSRYASPITLSSSWTVRVEAHYLGGLRHFIRWEVADIGVLLFIRKGGRIERSKVALLQSKRIYPKNMFVVEEVRSDFEIGFARLADPEDLARGIAVQTEFQFDETCEYGQIIPGSEQVAAIAEFEKQNKLQIYYQLYNPWELPFVQRVPLSAHSTPPTKMSLGVRIVPSAIIHQLLLSKKGSYRPTVADLAGAGAPSRYGWRLEHFIAGEFLGCREGGHFKSIKDEAIQTLFYRRSGPIAAAIAITIEAPGAAE